MTLITNQYSVRGLDNAISGVIQARDTTISSASLTQLALESATGGFGKVFIAVAVVLFFMVRPTLKALREYERKKKEGVNKYAFDPEALGIRKADFYSK